MPAKRERKGSPVAAAAHAPVAAAVAIDSPPGHRIGVPVLIGLGVAALAVRLYGIGWGLPESFEEATPLVVAWKMWGWGPGRPFDPNPHFFNYPSLTFYLQLLAQAILYLGYTVTGQIHASRDFVVRYVIDPTPFYLTGRLITALFGAGTVLATGLLAGRAAGRPAGLAAAVVLLMTPAHIAASQVIEVDVPLTFFVVVTLLLSLELARRPRPRTAALTGVMAGLAASTKYTGAFLVLPILVVHGLLWFDRRSGRLPSPRDRAVRGAAVPLDPARSLLLCLAAALVAFALTSPFVFLDYHTFQAHLMKERVHMQLGHFGLAKTHTWAFYLGALGRRMLGWPGLTLAVAGLAAAIGARKRWALVLAAFVVPYFIVISTWEMRADRYILPAVPILLVFAWSLPREIIERLGRRVSPRVEAGGTLAAAVALAGLLFLGNHGYLERLKADTRHLAREWIEKNLPPGAFVVTELNGPPLLDPNTIWQLETGVRKEIQRSGRVYAVQPLPMLQVRPELSAAFYDLDLYRMADLVVTSSLVRDRYMADPRLFAPQLAFYDSLESHFTKAATFAPSKNSTGPVITLYRNPAARQPFARRPAVEPPVRLGQTGQPPSGKEAAFYYSLGLNYETFGHPAQALTAYEFAAGYPQSEPGTFSNIVLGLARSLNALGRERDAQAMAERAERLAGSDLDRRVIRELARQLGGAR